MPENLFKDPNWLRQFMGRMKILMEEEGLKDQDEFNEKIGIQRALTRWKTGETKPGLRSFLAIKNAFDRPLDWIIFGEKQPLQISESHPKPSEEKPLSKIDFELANSIRCRIEGELDRAGKKLPEDLKLKLLIKIYNDFMEKHLSMEDIDINDYLWFLD